MSRVVASCCVGKRTGDGSSYDILLSRDSPASVSAGCCADPHVHGRAGHRLGDDAAGGSRTIESEEESSGLVGIARVGEAEQAVTGNAN